MTARVCCSYMERKLWQGRKEDVVHDVVHSAACKTSSQLSACGNESEYFASAFGGGFGTVPRIKKQINK